MRWIRLFKQFRDLKLTLRPGSASVIAIVHFKYNIAVTLPSPTVVLLEYYSVSRMILHTDEYLAQAIP